MSNTSFVVSSSSPSTPSPSSSASSGGATMKLHVGATPWVPPHTDPEAGTATHLSSTAAAGISGSSAAFPSREREGGGDKPTATGQSNKTVLCGALLELGYCPAMVMGAGCDAAHSLDELDPVAQRQLGALLTSSSSTTLLPPPPPPPPHPPHYAVLAEGGLGGEGPGPSLRKLGPRHQQLLQNPPMKGEGVAPPSPPASQSSESSNSSSGGGGGVTSTSFTVVGSGGGTLHTQQQQQQQQQHPPPLPPPCSSSSATAQHPQMSPFLKAQMFYSKNATRPSLPRRCQYPHATPGTYYDILNVKRNATTANIEERYALWRGEGYKKACGIDHARADTLDRLIVDAKTVLGSDKLREEYDALLRAHEDQPTQPQVHSFSAPSSSSASCGAPAASTSFVSLGKQQQQQQPLGGGEESKGGADKSQQQQQLAAPFLVVKSLFSSDVWS